MQRFLVGVDGGGTSCRAAVADFTGKVLGRGKSGPSNIMTAPDLAIQNIADAAKNAFIAAGLNAELMHEACAFLGLAGTNVDGTVDYIMPRLPFKTSVVDSDGLIALQGALGHGDGAVAILGTGTIYIVRAGNEIRYIGGWGFHLGDLGSGSRLGQMALQETLLAYDGITRHSLMTRSLMTEFADDPGKMVTFAQTAKPGDFGRFAPLVFQFGAEGDEAARSILLNATNAIDAALDRVMDVNRSDRLCLLGGLSELYAPYLAERHRFHLVQPAADALTGAIDLAVTNFASLAKSIV